MKQILPSLCDKVLVLGCEYRNPKGGVAYVLHTYEDIYHPFHFIATTTVGNKIKKTAVLCVGIIKFLWRMLFDKHIKIVHIHGSSYNSFYRKRIFIDLSKLFKKIIIYHIHGAEFKVFATQHHDAVAKTLAKCDAVVTLSEYWRAYFTNNFTIKHVYVIHNIIPNPSVCSGKIEDKAKLYLLFLGKLGNRKGIYDLLRAVQKHKNTFREKIRLYIGGNGETNKVESIIKNNGLGDMAFYCGWVDGIKKIDLLNKADVYVLPSYHEGLPISILEAMSYGIPIISTPVGGIPEIVNEDNGFLVQPGDVDALADKIMFFVRNPGSVQEMGKKSQEKVKPHLPDAVAESLTALYEQLLME